MQLKDRKHIIPSPLFAAGVNGFDLPATIAELQEQYYNWVRENAAELTAMLQDAASSHLMFDTDTEESEQVELDTQVSYNEEMWIAYMDRDGMQLRYADAEFDGEDWLTWGDLEKNPDLLGQVIADQAIRKLLN